MVTENEEEEVMLRPKSERVSNSHRFILPLSCLSFRTLKQVLIYSPQPLLVSIAQRVLVSTVFETRCQN